MKLTIAWLYPDSMSIYGDRGNVIALSKRAEWRGIEVQVQHLRKGDCMATLPDLVMFGGGQDREQRSIERDFLELKGPMLRAAVEEGVPVLAVCGGFQMLANGYRDADGAEIEGLGVLDATTVAAPLNSQRFIGDIVVRTDFGGELVGFENHGGRTRLGSCAPLGHVVAGHGNNGQDGTEGARFRNCFGTYMHGSLLPKNPWFTDLLLTTALRRRYDSAMVLPSLDDSLEERAHQLAAARARR
ncbi:MAG: gamma-glutamyl-gamma-aminobutyrate hydrolase family protein [Chloroflexota bacterium]|nr:gamma-glutamyl-gamma-aminobutyrate hydrolase family protein [Chloroflexota bacterium]